MSEIEIDRNYQKFGFCYNNQNITLCLPHFYQDYKYNEKEELFKTYRVLKKYKNDLYKQSLIKSEEKLYQVLKKGFNEKKFEFFEVIFSLLYDYYRNGIVTCKKNIVTNRRLGNINWQLTIRKSNIIINNDSIFYNDYYYNAKSSDLENELFKLHKTTIIEINNYLGEGCAYNNINFSNNDIERILRKAKQIFFSDRIKNLVFLLETFWLNSLNYSFYRGNDEMYFSQKFDMIWEKMLQYSLNDNYSDIKEIIPKGYYELNNIKFNGLGLRPDIILKEMKNNEEYLIIIDAKNYSPNFDERKGMPNSSDIGKQILYKLFMSKRFNKNSPFELNKIINCFFIPTISEKKSIEFLGVHNVNNIIDSSDKIYCFLVNYLELREVYLGKNDNYRQKIVNYIFKTFEIH